MKHKIAKASLNRPADHRKAMVRNLLTSLFLYGKVQTTDARARALAGEADKLITLVRSKDAMNAVRELKRVIFTQESSEKALAYITAQKERTSGYTRITKIGQRSGDNALVIQVELI